MSEGGDPFLLSGSTLSSGYCKMLITSVGENSRWGKTRAKLAVPSTETPLQEKLNVLAEQIGYLGMGTALATFVVLFAMWFYYPDHRPESITLVQYLLKAFIMCVTIVVVAVPEGLPLAVTLSLAFSTQKMMDDNNLIRVLAACETMGGATTICSDKTGTLTQNRMTVVQAWFGNNYYDTAPPSTADMSEPAIRHIAVNISVNSTAVLIPSPPGASAGPDSVIVSGSSTDGALLLLLRNSYNRDYGVLRAELMNPDIGDRLFTFSSQRKCMSALIVDRFTKSGKSLSRKDTQNATLYIKGASEVILRRCSFYLSPEGNAVPITAANRDVINKVISTMASQALRTVALAHRGVKVQGNETAEELENANTFILDTIVGIKDPLRPDVIEAVKRCHAAGIFVRMVTGDNIETAKAIARECGILTPGGVAMEGPDFRKLTPDQLDAVLPTLQVLARSSPTDKYILVTRLNGQRLPTTQKEWEDVHPGEDWETGKEVILPGYAEEWHAKRRATGGEVVGVTGDGTNDGPALKAADVGLSMGLSGTDGTYLTEELLCLCMYVCMYVCT